MGRSNGVARDEGIGLKPGLSPVAPMSVARTKGAVIRVAAALSVGVVGMLLALVGVSLSLPGASLLLPRLVLAADDSVCARVKIEIQQEMTLERQAFDAHMRIHNGLEGVMLENVRVEVSFADAEGKPVRASTDPDDTSALFFIRLNSLDNIANVDGSGTVAATTIADIHWLIIPAPGASKRRKGERGRTKLSAGHY